MLNKDDKNLIPLDSEKIEEEEDLGKAIDSTLDIITFHAPDEVLINDIIEAPSKEALERQLEIFNITQSKKNALRVIKLNNLLDKVEDQAIKRFEKRPDQVSNKELLDYMRVVAEQIDRSQKNIELLDSKPFIKVANQTNNQLNINVGPQLDRASKERVVDAITNLISQLENPTTVTTPYTMLEMSKKVNKSFEETDEEEYESAENKKGENNDQ